MLISPLKNRSITVVVFTVLVAMAALVYLSGERSRRHGGEAPVASAVQPVDVFRVNGLDYTSFAGEHPRFRVRADLIEVAKRKYGFVSLSPLKEAVVTNLDLEWYENAAMPLSAVLSGEMLAEALPAHMMQDVGVLTRVRVDGFRVTRYRNGKVVSTIVAQHADVDPRAKLTNLSGNVKVAVDDGHWVLSPSGTWDQRTGWFLVDGPYLVARDGRVTRGQGARFDSELRGI